MVLQPWGLLPQKFPMFRYQDALQAAQCMLTTVIPYVSRLSGGKKNHGSTKSYHNWKMKSRASVLRQLIPSLQIQSPCQRVIGLYNHLLSTVFRFHYQNVIGSLGHEKNAFFPQTKSFKGSINDGLAQKTNPSLRSRRIDKKLPWHKVTKEQTTAHQLHTQKNTYITTKKHRAARYPKFNKLTPTSGKCHRPNIHGTFTRFALYVSLKPSQEKTYKKRYMRMKPIIFKHQKQKAGHFPRKCQQDLKVYPILQQGNLHQVLPSTFRVSALDWHL